MLMANYFGSEALRLIAQLSEGIPRNINNICFSGLSLGFANGKKTIGASLIEEVIGSRAIQNDPTPDGRNKDEKFLRYCSSEGESSRRRKQEERSTGEGSQERSSSRWPGWIIRAAALVAAAPGPSRSIGFVERRSPFEAKPAQPGAILTVTPTAEVNRMLPIRNLSPSASEAPRWQPEESPLKVGRSIKDQEPNDTLWHISELTFRESEFADFERYCPI